jgi:hypothetical protein
MKKLSTMFSFHPIVMPLNKGSLWAGEGNKVWMRTSTNKLSQQWIWVKKTTQHLHIYLGKLSV